MNKIWIENDKIIITHGFDPYLNNKYRQLFFVWNPILKRREKKLSTFNPRTLIFLRELVGIKRYNWVITEDVKQILGQTRMAPETPVMLEDITMLPVPEVSVDIDFSDMKLQPFEYQKYCVGFMNANKGVTMLGLEPGLGKTNCTISYAVVNNLKQIIIVCPASLKYNWKSEVEKFSHKTATILTDYKVKELDPKKKLADFVIVNYEQLDKYKDYLGKAKFDCVVLDESHYISNLQAKRTKMVFKLFKKVARRICLSGTPIRNRPIDFYAQLKFLRPDEFSNKDQYGLRYCGAKETAFGWDLKGASNLEELNQRIAPFYIRRTKHDVLKDLPEKTVSLIEIDFNEKEKEAYTDLKEDFVRGVTERDFKETNASDLGKMMKMRQFCSYSKVDRVVEFVEDFLSSTDNRKIIIFSQFIATQKALKEKFKGRCASLLGEDSAEKRNAAVQAFQTDPNVRVFVASTIAAGVGLNLTAADTVAFCDLTWSPTDVEQAQDRAHRIGQKNAVSIYYFVFKNSIESMLWGVIGQKLAVINQALAGKTLLGPAFNAEKMIFQQLLRGS